MNKSELSIKDREFTETNDEDLATVMVAIRDSLIVVAIGGLIINKCRFNLQTKHLEIIPVSIYHLRSKLATPIYLYLYLSEMTHMYTYIRL